MDKKISRMLSQHKKNGAPAVYGYENGCIQSFEKAKDLGLECYYDLPSGHWRSVHAILKEETEKRPEWIETVDAFKDSERILDLKDKELELADKIFVASSFMVKSLGSYPKALKNIEVIPYGFPPIFQDKTFAEKKINKKIKLLFVGKMALQKGIANLFEAVQGLENHVELTIVGRRPLSKCEILDKELMKHKYLESLPNPEILKLMRENDVFVFPTLFDGFGLVEIVLL